jgi:hypothetical protein
MEILEYDPDTGAPLRLTGEYVRDEAGQARYLNELLEIFDAEGVDSAFAFLFALCNLPHRPDGDPRDDLDLASPSIVRMLEGRHGDTYPDMAWEPKAAFTAVAECYRDRSTGPLSAMSMELPAPGWKPVLPGQSAARPTVAAAPRSVRAISSSVAVSVSGLGVMAWMSGSR